MKCNFVFVVTLMNSQTPWLKPPPFKNLPKIGSLGGGGTLKWGGGGVYVEIGGWGGGEVAIFY